MARHMEKAKLPPVKMPPPMPVKGRHIMSKRKKKKKARPDGMRKY